ncbi:hypothetical protein [Serratia fonticola]|uniref:hypothetical protein n=1 Tax=Serratia fonticola TaxID=47917 RepID=UPI00301D3C0E
MDAINISKLDDYELDVFKRDIAQEIECCSKGTTLYSIKPVEITLADFEEKIATKYFDDICFEKRLIISSPNHKDKA